MQTLVDLRTCAALADAPAPAGERRGEMAVVAPPAFRLRAELLPVTDLGPVRREWEALARRAIEPNVHAEPEFLLAAGEHFADGGAAAALLIWNDRDAGAARLVGLFPLARRSRVPCSPAWGWLPMHSASGVPLVDAGCFDAVMATSLDALARLFDATSGVLFPSVPADEPFARALALFATRSGREVIAFDAHARAVVRRGPSGREALADALSAKKLKELRRQLRRLGDLGEVRFSSASESDAVRSACETFLALEASGWKRSWGTALLMDSGVATFVRRLLADLASSGRCRIDTLWCGATPVAVAVVIESGTTAWFWKTAFDESFARFSPGVQMAMHVTETQLARGSIALTDSGAIANHPMIDHLWRERMAVADLMIGVRPGSSLALGVATHAEHARRTLRAFAKRQYRRIVKGKMS